MDHYVYIIQSLTDGSFYKGYSTQPQLRLAQHNNGESHYTASKTPWKLIYVEKCPSKTAALIREKNLKKATRDRIIALTQSPKNILYLFQTG